MIKITLLCVILAIGYIQSIPTDIPNSTNITIGLPMAKRIDADSEDQVKFLSLLNFSTPIITQSEHKPSDMSTYYSWLNFLKSSTSTKVNEVANTTVTIHNSTIPLETDE